MLLVLFALALMAGVRGWLPWSILVFAAAYGIGVMDYGSVSATSLSPFGLQVTMGALLEYIAFGTLGAMIVFNRV